MWRALRFLEFATLIDLIVRYGTPTSKGVIVTRQDFARTEREAKHLIARGRKRGEAPPNEGRQSPKLGEPRDE